MRLRHFASLGFAVLLSGASPATVPVASAGTSAASSSAIGFQVPTVVDPIHTNGEPDVAIDPQGRVFVSGPTGTGTQRSTWFGSVDGGQTFLVMDLVDFGIQSGKKRDLFECSSRLLSGVGVRMLECLVPQSANWLVIVCCVSRH